MATKAEWDPRPWGQKLSGAKPLAGKWHLFTPQKIILIDFLQNFNGTAIQSLYWVISAGHVQGRMISAGHVQGRMISAGHGQGHLDRTNIRGTYGYRCSDKPRHQFCPTATYCLFSFVQLELTPQLVLLAPVCGIKVPMDSMRLTMTSS